MKTHMTIPDDLAETARETNEVVAQYRRIAVSAITDAESWLRHDALTRAIAEAIPDAMLVTDEAGMILLVNTQFELMFGYHRSEVIGQATEMLMPEAVRMGHLEHRRRYADDPRVRSMGDSRQLTARRKDGVEFKAIIRIGPAVIPTGIFTIVVIRRVRE